MHNACRSGKADCVEILLLNGANANMKNNKGQRPADMVKSNSVNKDRILELIDKSLYGQCVVLY